MEPKIDNLGIIAGRGIYPRVLAESARAQGVGHLSAVAFKRETDRVIENYVDAARWVTLGQLDAMLEALQELNVKHVVMAGQIKPTHLFNVRVDKAMWTLLSGLKQRNAHTIFGAVGDALKERGITLLEASMFMKTTMPAPGNLTSRKPTEQEQADIALGLQVAKTTSALEIGQTVVIKEGTILAVEAFEGTDEAIRRAGRLGGAGAIVVKVAKQGHDMRFDIPVVGERTLKMMKKIKASVLAVEANRTIFLDRDRVLAEAERQGLCCCAVVVNREMQEIN